MQFNQPHQLGNAFCCCKLLFPCCPNDISFNHVLPQFIVLLDLAVLIYSFFCFQTLVKETYTALQEKGILWSFSDICPNLLRNNLHTCNVHNETKKNFQVECSPVTPNLLLEQTHFWWLVMLSPAWTHPWLSTHYAGSLSLVHTVIWRSSVIHPHKKPIFY